MDRAVHAEGLREQRNVREAGVSGGTEYRFECKYCGADHGDERHYGECPECDATPVGWTSTMAEVLDG